MLILCETGLSRKVFALLLCTTKTWIRSHMARNF